MKFNGSIYCVGLVIFGMVSAVHGYKILLLTPFPGKSHFLMFDTIIHGLLERGHHVTCLTGISLNAKPELKNYTEILIDPPFNFEKLLPPEQIFKEHDQSVIANHFRVWGFTILISRFSLQSKAVREFILDESQEFDLVISEQFFQECFLMFAHKYRAPLIAISTIGYSDYADHSMGLRSPYSFVPHHFSVFTDRMTFVERSQNFLISMFDLIVRATFYLPQMNNIAHEAFGHLERDGEKLPTVQELDDSKALIMANTHLAFDYPRPKLPGMIDIGGLSLRKKLAPLPADIQKFLDEAEHGVIYFSFGSFIVPSKAPKESIEKFVRTFVQLKQRVLWKWDATNFEGLPDNIMVKAWMPQKEILAHPNVKLFISHGGMFGLQESLYHGVPLLIIPFYGDQRKNSQKAQNGGYALSLDFDQITVDGLTEMVNEMITNDTYRTKAKELSFIFQDSLVDPLDEALYWIEYVIRHKGAEHLKSYARNLNFFQYFMWDVFGTFLVAFILFTIIMYKIFDRLFGKKTVESDRSMKKKSKKKQS